MQIRTLLVLASALGGCGTAPPPMPVTVESTPSAPLVVGSGDAKRPPTKSAPAEGTDPLDEQPALRGEPVGAKAPGFTAKTVNGKAATPFKNRVTVIHFWATWCGPCKKSLPALAELSEKKHDAGLDVIAVSVDDEEAGLAEFASDAKVTFAVGWDSGHKVASKYMPSSMPSTYVIDREGVIRFLHLGYHDGEADEIAKEVADLLAR